ncbi:ABC transporter related protein [Desulfobulbus propionicus DSM 2032]|uniref:ABC transporter related protein n=1 Tax=Desulfobulbus propionicus (strain ATCC 33891 / DSM 2032 / VKM B-1956 / 1pr3) TaxID=577650 RepID=A0A7U4DN05_DESPD|nr:ABC transporter ATP-binding protein [Desulfobulbus propionicus]ADW16437.1 ABC transporter related protein [Desulfobulbus propionicus DSM 2032]
MTAPGNGPLIIASGLEKTYPLPESGRLCVLDGAGFTLQGGTTLAVTGQSGSGKSTLIALLAGLDRPDHGQITINGTELTGLDEAGLTRFRAAHIGIVFQQFHLLPHLTAEENVRLPLELLHRPCEAEAIDALLERVGLAARRGHLPSQLSGGECQRVAIARALAVKPLLLLADEPTGNLDVATGREVSDLLFHLVEQERMTMVVVTHNQELADRCHRRLRLTEGVLR